MSPLELAQAYHGFFYKGDVGRQFIETIEAMEGKHLTDAQRNSDMQALSKSAGIREVLDHIKAVVAQVADQ